MMFTHRKLMVLQMLLIIMKIQFQAVLKNIKIPTLLINAKTTVFFLKVAFLKKKH